MRKILLALMMLLLFCAPALAKNQINHFSGTKTNVLVDDSSYLYADLKDYDAFAVRFKITIPDSLKSDSLTPRVETSNDLATWSTAFSFAKYVGDTTTKYQIFTTDSLFKYKIQRYVRLKIPTTGLASVDTASAETLQVTGNGSVLGWFPVLKTSPGGDTTRSSVLNETALDTTDYDSSKTANAWLALSFANHTKLEATITSIVLVSNGGWDTDSAWIKYGLSLGANATGAETLATKRTLSARTLLKQADTTTYSTTFTTNPYGTAWKWYQLDSLCFVAHTDSVKSGAIAKLNKVIAIVNYTIGNFEPAISWEGSWYLRQGK